MSNYEAIYEKRFVRNLARYASMRVRIKRRVEKILEDPYRNTEFLGDAIGKLNLIGCRSVRIDRNFRIIFVNNSYAPFRKTLSNIRDPGQAGDFKSAPTGRIYRNQPRPD